MIGKIAIPWSIAVLALFSTSATATVWTITGGSLTSWFTQGVSGSGLQNIYENGFGSNADWTHLAPTRFNGYNCAGIGGLVDLSCGDDNGEGAVPEIWGAAVVYGGLIDDGGTPGDLTSFTGTFSWTGESGTAAIAGLELFTNSATSGSYDIAQGAGVAGLTGTFGCWNNPVTVNTYGADFCGNATGGATPTTLAGQTLVNRSLPNGMTGFADNGDGTITVTLADLTYSDCLAAGPTNCIVDSNSSNTYGTWTFNATAVPVPAAVWLFGSALGLLGWLGRKTA